MAGNTELDTMTEQALVFGLTLQFRTTGQVEAW
jgi:hypothetical protein